MPALRVPPSAGIGAMLALHLAKKERKERQERQEREEREEGEEGEEGEEKAQGEAQGQREEAAPEGVRQ